MLSLRDFLKRAAAVAILPAAMLLRPPLAAAEPPGLANQLAAANRTELLQLSNRLGIAVMTERARSGTPRVVMDVTTQAQMDRLSAFAEAHPNVLQLVVTKGAQSGRTFGQELHLRAIFRGEHIHDMRMYVNPRHPKNVSGMDRVNRLGHWDPIDLRRGEALSVLVQLDPTQGDILARRLNAAWKEQGRLPPPAYAGQPFGERVMTGAFLRGQALGVDPKIQDCVRTFRNVQVGSNGERLVEVVGLNKYFGHAGGGRFLHEIHAHGNGRVIGMYRASAARALTAR
jgi:hypothetical protein